MCLKEGLLEEQPHSNVKWTRACSEALIWNRRIYSNSLGYLTMCCCFSCPHVGGSHQWNLFIHFRPFISSTWAKQVVHLSSLESTSQAAHSTNSYRLREVLQTSLLIGKKAALLYPLGWSKRERSLWTLRLKAIKLDLFNLLNHIFLLCNMMKSSHCMESSTGFLLSSFSLAHPRSHLLAIPELMLWACIEPKAHAPSLWSEKTSSWIDSGSNAAYEHALTFRKKQHSLSSISCLITAHKV